MGNFILQLSRLSNLFSDVLDLPLRDRLKMNKKTVVLNRIFPVYSDPGTEDILSN